MIVSFLSVVGAALLVVADQLIKQWANAVLQSVGAITLLPGIVELRYYLNDGMAFSMLAGKQTLLIVMTSIMLVCVLALLLLRKMNPWERVSWMLILGGGVSNLLERLKTGKVYDYVQFPKAPGRLKQYVYNLADFAIFLGGMLLVLRRKKR